MWRNIRIYVHILGFFPVNSNYDYFWINFFKLGLPQSVLRYIGTYPSRILINIIVKLFSIKIDSLFLEYWFSLQTNPATRSHEILNKFLNFDIKFYFNWQQGVYFNIFSYGKTSALPALLNITELPVALLYGMKDSVAPPHQGRW